jgi:hypothetical protein
VKGNGSARGVRNGVERDVNGACNTKEYALDSYFAGLASKTGAGRTGEPAELSHERSDEAGKVEGNGLRPFF